MNQASDYRIEIDRASDYGLTSSQLKQRYPFVWAPLVAVLPATDGYLNRQQQKG